MTLTECRTVADYEEWAQEHSAEFEVEEAETYGYVCTLHKYGEHHDISARVTVWARKKVTAVRMACAAADAREE
jgi:hypothetical protein